MYRSLNRVSRITTCSRYHLRDYVNVPVGEAKTAVKAWSSNSQLTNWLEGFIGHMTPGKDNGVEGSA
jgi:hypothetical protein